jgi:hypothetical protein
MRYGLNAAIVAGVFCLALGETALIAVGHFSDYLAGSGEIASPAERYFESDIYFHDGNTIGGVKLHPDGRRVARIFVSRSWRCRPFEVTLS